MPLSKWSVEPVFMSRKPIPPDKTLVNELVTTSNNTLVAILRQLSSLVKVSDKIFGELADECHRLCQRTVSLRLKVNRCETIVDQLNAKSVKVPVANLNTFLQLEEHHFSSNNALDSNLFTVQTRPIAIKEAYLTANQTPVNIIREIDSCRSDGRCGSKLFVCQPIFADMKKKVNFIDIETRRPASLVLAHDLPRNVVLERAKTPLCSSHHVILNNKETQRNNNNNININTNNSSNNNNNKNTRRKLLANNNNNYSNADDYYNNGYNGKNINETDSQQNPLYGVISPEEQMVLISQEYPSKYVPIDVTGNSFTRMSNLRRSLIHADFLIRRKKPFSSTKGKRAKRRNTICQSANELSGKEGSGGRRNRVRRRSASSIDFVHTSCQTDFNDTEIYTSERVVEVGRCQTKSDDALSHNNSSGRENRIKFIADVHHYESRSLEDIINTNRAHRTAEANMPEVMIRNEANNDANNNNNNNNSSSVGNCNNNDIEKCKNVVAVKMRENANGKGVADDGRSSSGNWSASSSTHASVDSDHVIMGSGAQLLKNGLPHTLSNSSLGKDSVISEGNTTPVPPNENSDGRTSAQEINCYSSQIVSHNTNAKCVELLSSSRAMSDCCVVIRANNAEMANKIQYANRDSESWLQYYDHDSSDTVTPTPTESESGQTSQTQPSATVTTPCCESSRRSSFSVCGGGSSSRHSGNDDEAESVYSVDTDGYYTSMHTDSGLFRVPVKLMLTPNSSFRCKGKRDSIASTTTVGDISINSILSKTETESSSTTLTNRSSTSSRGKLPPPLPPPRVSSMLRSFRSDNHKSLLGDSGSENGCTTGSNASTSSRSHSPSPAGTITSESENSDAQQQLRLKFKTLIDSSRYPSMCAMMSTEGSDDGKSQDSSSTDGSNRVTPTGKMIKSRSGSYRGFRIRDIFGGFGLSAANKDERNSPLTVGPTTPHIATIRRAQSPIRFNMYNGEGSKYRRFAEKVGSEGASSSTLNYFQTPNIVRANAISSFATDLNECCNEDNDCSAATAHSSRFSNPTAITSTKAANTNNNTLEYNKSSNSCCDTTAENTSKSVQSTATTTITTTTTMTSKQVPHPNSFNSNSAPKMLPSFTSSYPVSRQVSIPIPRTTDRKSSSVVDEQKTTTTCSISRPTTLPIPVTTSAAVASRSVARVTLDANGCVIYASNSLGRRRDGHPMNYLNQLQKSGALNTEETNRCSTLPMASRPRVSSPLSHVAKPGALVHINQNGYIECINGAANNMKQQSSQPILTPGSNASSGYNSATTPMSNNIISANNKANHPNSAPSSRCVTPVVAAKKPPVVAIKPKCRPIIPATYTSNMNNNCVTDHNKLNDHKSSNGVATNGGVVVGATINGNNNQKSYIESDLSSEFCPQNTSSPVVVTQNENINNNNTNETKRAITPSTDTIKRRGRLTTEDLLIIIHNSKKKHNIKTEPEIIIPNSPSSSRCESMSNSSSSPGSANGCPTTPQHLSANRSITPSFTYINGAITPTTPTNSDRRSWSGTTDTSDPVSQPGCRRSLASDRLGPPKPTTMNDFKRLLSQTRSNTGTNERLSAAEILRTNQRRPATPVVKPITNNCAPILSQRISPSPHRDYLYNNNNAHHQQSHPQQPLQQQQATPPPQIVNGCVNLSATTIIKPRIINRSNRSPYRLLESTYPPILEDCSEDTTTDDKKCYNAMSSAHKQQRPITPVVFNNYSKVAANPNSTSTWV